MKENYKCIERFGDIYPLITAGTIVRIKSKKIGCIVMTLEKTAIDCAYVLDRLCYLRIEGIKAINSDTLILTVDDTNYDEDEGEE